MKNQEENKDIQKDEKKLGFSENDVMLALMKLPENEKNLLLANNKIIDILSSVNTLKQRESTHKTLDIYINYYRNLKLSFIQLCEILDSPEIDGDVESLYDSLIANATKFKSMLESRLSDTIQR